MSQLRYHGILSFTGGIFTMLAIGHILPFASLSSYLTSENNPQIFPCNSFLYFALILFVSNLTNLFSMTIAQITGTKIITFFGIILMGSGYLLLYFKIEQYFHLIAMAFIGMGIGLQFNPILTNIWCYYPDSKGLASLTLMVFYGVSSVLFIGVVEYMFSSFYLNGELETTQADKAAMISNYFLIIIIITVSLGFISFLTTSNHNNTKEDHEDELLLKEKSINDDNLSQSNYKDLEYSREEIIQEPTCFNCRIIFHSIRFWLIILMSKLSFIFCYTFTHSLRFIGLHNGFDPCMIVIGLILYPSIITLSRVIIAFLYNCLEFKILFSMILLYQIFIAAFIPFISNEYVYLAFIALSGFCYAGNSIMIAPFITKIYGSEYSFELSGIVNLFSSVSVFALPLVSLFFGKALEIQKLIKYIFFGCAGTSAVALLLCCFISDATFDYNCIKGTLAHNLSPYTSSEKERSHHFIGVKSEINSDPVH